MSNKEILQRVRDLHEQYVQGDLPLEELGASLRGCVEAMEGLNFHKHVKWADDFIIYMEHPTWASDGNIHDRRVDEEKLLAEFRDWLREVEQVVE